jgi:hypothetical protein
MSTELDLEQAILDSELRYVNFFNGRLLTGGDLSAEQAANRACSRHLGLAVGAGVAYGLEVSISPGSLTTDALVDVAAGLAVNRDGQTLRLESKQTVALVRPPDQLSTAGCVFADCQPLAAGTTLSSAGYYLLTIAPTSARDGLAPASGLGNGIANCNSRYLVDGVQFRLLPLNVTQSDNPNLERNSVAYQCFGLPALGPGDFLDEASGAGPLLVYGVEALVPAGRLTEQDVPLAVIEWTPNGLGFIDQWSVRRRVTRPDASGRWGYFAGDRRVSEGEAMFLQFQEQFATLETGTSPPQGLTANSHFRFLPPGGVLPDPDGTFWPKFLGPLGPLREIAIDASLWPRLLRESFTLEPVPVPDFNVASQFVGAAPPPNAVGFLRKTGVSSTALQPLSLAGLRVLTNLSRSLIGLGVSRQNVSDALISQLTSPRSIGQLLFGSASLISNQPPVPLKVYRVPGSSEVLFVRSRLGRVRLFFPAMPPQGLEVAIRINKTNVLLFAVAANPGGKLLVIDDVPAGTHFLVVVDNREVRATLSRILNSPSDTPSGTDSTPAIDAPFSRILKFVVDTPSSTVSSRETDTPFSVVVVDGQTTDWDERTVERQKV